MKFILEKKELLFDFQHTLLRSREYYEWWDRSIDPELRTEFEITFNTKNPKVWCPVGSVEFCTSWYRDVWNKVPLPINVPSQLIPLQKRKIGALNDVPGRSVFTKNTKIIKHPDNGMKLREEVIKNDCQISEVIDIISEWRCFVYNRTFLDIKCYSGDPFTIPRREYVENMINAYKDSPVAYTLDIACTPDGEEVIEVHDFFSCGLYGFDDLKNYPHMLWRWFKEFTKNVQPR